VMIGISATKRIEVVQMRPQCKCVFQYGATGEKTQPVQQHLLHICWTTSLIPGEYEELQCDDVADGRGRVKKGRITQRDEGISRYVTGFIMTQMTAKQGIKKHKEVAVET